MPRTNRDDLIRYALGQDEEPEILIVADPPLRTAEPEKKPPEMPQDAPKPVPETVRTIPKTFPAGTCQNCGNTLTELGGARRCALCGWQAPYFTPPGVSRAQLADKEWRRQHCSGARSRR
jgi:hypothetical protein